MLIGLCHKTHEVLAGLSNETGAEKSLQLHMSHSLDHNTDDCITIQMVTCLYSEDDVDGISAILASSGSLSNWNSF